MNKFSWSTVIYTALGIFFIVLCIWYYGASEYRYSSERIARRMRSKYVKASPKDQFLDISDAELIENGTKAKAMANMKDIATGNIMSSEVMTISILSDAKCPMYPKKMDCISL